MIYNKNILTREDISNISDLSRLNKLIGEYTTEANRRVRNLTRYKGVGHRKTALKHATKFAGGMSRLPGARLEDIKFSSEASYTDVRKARRALGNLASYIRSPYSTIAGTGKKLKESQLLRARSGKATINRILKKQAVTIKSLMGLSEDDWEELRKYIEQNYGILDSSEVIDTYTNEIDDKGLEKTIEELSIGTKSKKKNRLDKSEWSKSL